MVLWDIFPIARVQGPDWEDQHSFRLESTATCHSISAPARNHSISAQAITGSPGWWSTLWERRRESLLLRRPSPGILFLSITSPGRRTHWATWPRLWPLQVCDASIDNSPVRTPIWFEFMSECFEVSSFTAAKMSGAHGRNILSTTPFN